MVICVGTSYPPRAAEPDLTDLRLSISWAAQQLRPGQLVVARSTVPIGTTRSVILPGLEESGLRAGQDFMLAFCPERTVEGAAIDELGRLPQIVGGINDESGEYARKLFERVTPYVIQVSSPEAAEAVKLLDNTFRDVRFGFANSVAQLFEELGLNTFELVRAANYKYPRNSIPVPSPGVGGSCIPKDSRFLDFSARQVEVDIPLIAEARRANETMTRRLAERIQRTVDLSDARVFIAGFAFKGVPETNDMRESPTLDLVDEIAEFGAQISGYDPAINADLIASTGADPVETLNEGLTNCDVCVFMTNHREFTAVTTKKLAQWIKPGTLVVDGWGMFDRQALEDAGMRYLGVAIG
jgi:UDP-N-acetyl-D-mannosaminuronic acid dehydrogenase